MNLKARLDIVRDKKAEEYTNNNFATLHSDHPFLIEQGKRLMVDNHKSGFSSCSSILLPMVLEMREALEYYIKNGAFAMYEYIGEHPHGGYQPVLTDWEIAEKALENLEQKIKEMEK